MNWYGLCSLVKKHPGNTSYFVKMRRPKGSPCRLSITREMACPMALVVVSRELKNLPIGEVLEIKGDNQALLNDLRIFIKNQATHCYNVTKHDDFFFSFPLRNVNHGGMCMNKMRASSCMPKRNSAWRLSFIAIQTSARSLWHITIICRMRCASCSCQSRSDAMKSWPARGKHQVCPFELSLDMAVYCEVIICDYNYAFDPRVRLDRFFNQESLKHLLLVDEAHNLPDRSRSMYSASLG